ncbi:lysozyme inhibitor LprI family protein [Rhodohalobacter barkolensis]|uniref:Lysozyme inhibitor LprI-like N-terminal domain-containing protein n=1 Tax=Rhodohalobacter barkolensis TaxID=2053187 RepID=A0A2N0VGP1_9BACT|nr:lysozyme inhibitor LprI family protein [Rhodohalobacter barkolensis]PKD43372.1 hypothetical protein CWD77_12255 [Rhodohalobacter barkolensis]
MKLFIFISLALITNLHSASFAQNNNPRSITQDDSLKIENTISKELEQLGDSLRVLDKFYLDEQFIEFKSDTFAIERRREMRMEINWSTAGMNNASYAAEREYDQLLNKYYQKLLGKLDDEDKEILRQSQRNWIRFRDSERDVNYMLTDWQYSGGGTIQTTINANHHLEITKHRVIELYRYLSRFM